jgi:pimeloyl-ACP methyl ester carboxylesterase
MSEMSTLLAPLPLPEGVRSRTMGTDQGLQMHFLEAGFEGEALAKPLLLLLHGFPELAFSWRHQLPALAAAGYHVVAPDQRGYGRTTGGDDRYEGDWQASHMLQLVADAQALVQALGHSHVACVIGHDFGSPVAAWCALTRPDFFHAVVMMSAPFAGPPPALDAALAHHQLMQVVQGLGKLHPPRQHYQWYYSGPQANADMWQAPQGLHAFLRAYYHVKSADWADNRPHPLAGWTAQAWAELPAYYIMGAAQTMAEAVAPFMPTNEEIAHCAWLPEDDLRVYVAEYQRTGFQGGLQWYRCGTDAQLFAQLGKLWGEQRIEVPAAFIAGASDWGVYQMPDAFEAMQTKACTHMRLCQLIPHAGHWVQQERPPEVNALLLSFLDGLN